MSKETETHPAMHSLVRSLGLMLLLLLTVSPCLAEGSAPRQGLQIRIREVKWPEVTVEIVNASSEDVRIWEPGNSWGWKCLSFEVRSGEVRTLFIVRREGTFTGNIPSTEKIGPGRSVERIARLGDGSWKLPAELDLLKWQVSITAVYASERFKESKPPQEPEALRRNRQVVEGVWKSTAHPLHP